ncbi:MAG TPA: hypothetical protein VID47_09910, partial [Actinomycetota bacterium]
MRRLLAAAAAVALLTAGLVGSSARRASASTTYTWTGNSPADPHAWGAEKNWEPEGVPQDGDSVNVDKGTTIVGVPTITLDSLSAGGAGPTLVGGSSTITTNTLTWSRGRIAASLVVNVAAQLSSPGPGVILDNGSTQQGAPPVTFTNNGSVVQTGPVALNAGANAGAKLVNEGTWSATVDSSITSSHCCNESTGEFVNDGILTLTGDTTVVQARFQARPGSSVLGAGTLRLFGGVPEFTGPWNLGGSASIRLTDGAKATIHGTTTIGSGCKLQQEPPSEIHGTGVLGGSGTYRWLGGVILANLTLASSLGAVIEGSGPHELSDGLHAGVLTVEDTVTQKDGTAVLMNGRIVNKGTWHVPTAAEATIEAGGCCAAPKRFQNEGTIEIDSAGRLALNFLEYSNPVNKGVIEGGGTAQLVNGIHELKDGGTVRGSGTRLEIISNAEVHAAGTLKLDHAAVLIDHAR